MSLSESLRALKNWASRSYWDVNCKDAFLASCPPKARILDVGCGNDSPVHMKTLRPDFYYVGVDIGDYKQISDPRSVADEYVIATPESFAFAIRGLPTTFDAVVSAHNIEHCNEPEQTLDAMLSRIHPGGRIFLAFPSEASAHFPSRPGTLNFHDDPTHVWLPKFDDVCARIAAAGFRLDVKVRRNRPLRHVIRGLLNEPAFYFKRKVTLDTWALYGFESIIWATRVA